MDAAATIHVRMPARASDSVEQVKYLDWAYFSVAPEGVPLISIRKLFRWQLSFSLCLAIIVGYPLAGHGQSDDHSVPALLVSDIHFDPFHDPAMVRQLVAAPVNRWASILAAPPSPDQQQAFTALQQKCHARGVDTPFALLRSSLQAMRTRESGAKFMTVSGDLITHGFYCRYTTLVPGSTQSEYQDFVVKTLNFVMEELRASFPRIPIYVALGNNDTACDDYRLDARSTFLAQTGRIVAKGLPLPQRQQMLEAFARGGHYSLTMEAPMSNTRLIVVNDLFLSTRYSTCTGRPDPVTATAEMSWLQEQLLQARRLGRKVWVMGHIPPGIDPYSTVAEFKNICGNQPPVSFLSSDTLADLLVEYGDVVRLGIFAHSHMDEMRLLEPQGSAPSSSSGHDVAVKIVPSISPVDGNNPAFTVARINPSSAVLQDYEVIAASNQTGIAAAWSREYDYAGTYHEAEFSPTTLKKLIAGFARDRGATTEASQAYIHNYYVGDRSAELKPFWPLYVCAMANHTGKAFAACVCAAGK